MACPQRSSSGDGTKRSDQEKGAIREGAGFHYEIACNRLSYSTITMQGYTVAENA